jgi:hypothetical protein
MTMKFGLNALLFASGGAAAAQLDQPDQFAPPGGAVAQLERQHVAQAAAQSAPGRQQQQMHMMQQVAQQRGGQLQRGKAVVPATAAAPLVGSNKARRPSRALYRRQQAAAQALLGPVTPAKGAKLDKIPMVGLGTFGFFTKKAATDAIVSAFQKGLRHIDAAMIYQNEPQVGAGIAEGLKRTGLKREEIWVTTKLWNNRSARRPKTNNADGSDMGT